MICYPSCANCSGLCKQPQESVEATNARRVASSTGSSNPGYIEMTCGHYSTPEEQRAVRPHKPKGRKFWCSKCNKWLQQVKRCVDCNNTFGAHHHGNEKRCQTCRAKHVGLDVLF